MNEKKFTPGPWEKVEHSWSDTGIYPVSDKNNRLCVLSIHDEATEETQYSLEKTMVSNANLIAAAPELLEALEFLMENYKRVDGLGFETLPTTRAISAIAKAYGETP